MTKREIIDQIVRLNQSAQPKFLASFSQEELLAYLRQLTEIIHDRREKEPSAELVGA